MKKLIRNSISRFMISYIIIFVVPLTIVSTGFQIAFNIVEDSLKVIHTNMLQRSADMIENELVDVESVALQMASDNVIQELASMQKSDSNYISTALDSLGNFSLYLNYKEIDLLNS